MRILGLDLETTGLDLKKDRALKLGICVAETDQKTIILEKEWTLWHDTYPEISASAFETHKIEKKDCLEFGIHPTEVIDELAFFIDRHGIKFLVAHNGNNFDFPLLIELCESFSTNVRNFYANFPKIDTATDVPYPDYIQTRKLSHLAAEHGFLNPFPHSTLSDVRTMLKVLWQYPIEKVIERAKSPTLTVRAMVNFETRDLAKARRYQWDSVKQIWTKKIKACDLDKEIKEAQFQVVT